MSSQTPLAAAVSQIAKPVEPHTTAFDAMPDSSVVRKPALRSLIPVSDETIRRWEAEGGFPKRLQLGPRCVGWRLGDIRRWLASRANGVAA